MSANNGDGHPQTFSTCEEYVDHFIRSLRDRKRFVQYQYARGPRNWTGACGPGGALLFGRGHPEGIFLAWEGDNGELHFGWSLRHPTDEPCPFSRAVGLKLAIRRSIEGINYCIPRRQVANYYNFVQESFKFFQFWGVRRPGLISHAQSIE